MCIALFKAHYFWTSDFFGTKLGTSLGCIWRNILSAKDVVKRGARWSIGTRNNIPLINQPWLACGESISAIYTFIAQYQTICVSKLIYHKSKSWK